MSTLPRYPIYVPSRSRAQPGLTARFLVEDKVPFKLVVEPAQFAEYAERHGAENCLVLPWDNPAGAKDGLIKARNWIKAHATAAGYERHWQLDDNIYNVKRLYYRRRIRVESGVAFALVEDFVDRYENVAVAGLNYESFGFYDMPAFHLNVHVYSCTLVLNAIPHFWRSAYNDDTDICLQVLSDGWCTVLINAFLAHKAQTMRYKGGNTDDLYKINDGRLKMSRALERIWPRVVATGRRFHRPQHVVKYNWQKFDTPLKFKPGIDLATLAPNEYGLELKPVRDIKTDEIRQLVEHNARVHENNRTGR